MYNLSDIIKIAAKNKKRTLGDVAKRMGIRLTSLSPKLNGSRSITIGQIRDLCRYSGCEATLTVTIKIPSEVDSNGKVVNRMQDFEIDIEKLK